MGGFRIVDDAEAIVRLTREIDARAFPALDSHPLFGTFQRKLYRSIHPDSHPAVNLAVLDRAGPAVMVAATLDKGVISSFGLPATIAMRQGLDAEDGWKACEMAVKHLLTLVPEGGHALIRGGGCDTIIDQYCAYRQARAATAVYAVADLSQDEATLERQLRRSYRYEIRWGRTNLRMVHVGADFPDSELFGLLPEFHATVAGGSRYGAIYWQVMFDELVAGNGELSLGWLGDALVSATLTIDRGETAYYTSGVYDRERFDQPISHWPVFEAMLRAKARGRRWFDMGQLATAENGASDKEANIGFFKRGFVRNSRIELVWTVPRKS